MANTCNKPPQGKTFTTDSFWQSFLSQTTMQMNLIHETDAVMHSSGYTTNQKLQAGCRWTQSHKQAECYLPTLQTLYPLKQQVSICRAEHFSPCVFMAECQTGLITLQGRYSTSKLLCVSNAARVTRPE